MLIDLIAGARPNFMKIAPIIHALDNAKLNGENIDYRIIHTGQHYDENMSKSFFKQLDIPEPNFNLKAGGGSHSEQTAKIMIGYEKILSDKLVNYCLVVGDVNSTMACAIVAKKMHIKVIHVEAGIRSGDMSMPEEVNRIITDSISDYFFTTSVLANNNLRKVGVPDNRIFFVGNTMIDSLVANIKNLKKPEVWDKFKLKSKNFIIVTLHRPSNVDKNSKFKEIIRQIIDHSNGINIIFPVHPRLKSLIDLMNLNHPNLHLIEPLSYFEFNFLVKESLAVITDSGGITEETTYLNIPCITIRDNTERPETVEIGTNILAGENPDEIGPLMKKVFLGLWKQGSVPKLWDGKSAKRIVNSICKF